MARDSTTPWVVVMTGRVSIVHGWRCVGTTHRRLDLACRQADHWRDAWFALTGEPIPMWTWTVVDVRTGETVYKSPFV